MEEPAPLVLSERLEGGVALLTLNRPDRRNALSPGLVAALHDAVLAAGQDAEVRAVVITGAGDRAFCAGGDLGGGGFTDDGALAAIRGRGRFAELLLALRRLGKPVVAAVNGDALGGGFGLMLGCDMVVARPGVRLGTPEVKVGLFPMIILAELQRCLPPKLLSELVFTARLLSAEEALSAQLINRVEDDALAGALALARTAASFSPAVVRLGKDAMFMAADLPYEPALRYLHGQLEANLMSEDSAEGIMAFLGKRPPVWSGR